MNKYNPHRHIHINKNLGDDPEIKDYLCFDKNLTDKPEIIVQKTLKDTVEVVSKALLTDDNPVFNDLGIQLTNEQRLATLLFIAKYSDYFAVYALSIQEPKTVKVIETAFYDSSIKDSSLVLLSSQVFANLLQNK